MVIRSKIEYAAAMNRNELLPHVKTWMNVINAELESRAMEYKLYHSMYEFSTGKVAYGIISQILIIFGQNGE